MASISFEASGLDELANSLMNLSYNLENYVTDALYDIGQHAVERSRANAPILSGELRQDLVATPVKKTADGLEIQIIDTAEYALKMHEAPYELGPISAQQPTTEEGGVGNKYIERVIQTHWEQRYQRQLGDAVQEALNQAATKGKSS